MLTLTPHILTALKIELGEPSVTERDGLLIPATVNGALIELSMLRPDHLSCRPTPAMINGVLYDMSWWATKGGNVHNRPTASGWRDRSLRVQRAGSTAIRDYTAGAFRLGCRLMDAIIDAVAADPALLKQAAIVSRPGERLLMRSGSMTGCCATSGPLKCGCAAPRTGSTHWRSGPAPCPSGRRKSRSRFRSRPILAKG